MDNHLSVWWGKETNTIFVDLNHYGFSLSFVSLSAFLWDLVTNFVFAIEIMLHDCALVDLDFLYTGIHQWYDELERKRL